MRRPTIPRKPPAPSIHPVLGPAVERARKLSKFEAPRSEAELVADIEHDLGLPAGWLDSIRQTEKPRS